MLGSSYLGTDSEDEEDAEPKGALGVIEDGVFFTTGSWMFSSLSVDSTFSDLPTTASSTFMGF